MTKRYLLPWCVLAVVLTGCQTPKKPLAPPPPPAAHELFQPAWNVTTVQTGAGRYPDLFSGACRAIWIDSSVAELKKEATPATSQPDPGIDADAKAVTNAYIVIECQLESQFGDMSIAYDAIRLRGIDAYLETPDGMKVRPIQMRSYGKLKEEQVGALKKFNRTTVMIFPRQDLGAGMPVLSSASPAVRLVLDGHDSKYFFEWPGIPSGQTGPRMPTPEEAKYIAQLGYYELFTDVRRLAHVFD